MPIKKKSAFVCSECGYESPKWCGSCPSCKNWNTMEEQDISPAPVASSMRASRPASKPAIPLRVSEIDRSDEPRFSTGMAELDRVLGGGVVRGSISLIAGEPGIGKSTLLLQICQSIAKNMRVLYVTGEESARQLRLRADRLNVEADGLYVLAETDLDVILATVSANGPELVIVDSIQTICRADLTSAAGSITQVRECTMALMQLAKADGCAIMVVGHVNKEGAIAGPKVLEHMVDCVLSFEGERHISYRILRAAKNRFGSTNEIGVFEMGDKGLIEVPNPSAALLAGRPAGVPGTCITCVMEGSRPILAEVQALVTPTVFGNPRRTSSGIDYNRAVLLLAVMEKRAGLYVNNCDAYINVIGGLQLDEPASDLAAVLAIASSFKDKPLPEGMAAFGEVGLTGEVRSVQNYEQRLAEAARMGIVSCIMPSAFGRKAIVPEGLKIKYVKNINEAIAVSLD